MRVVTNGILTGTYAQTTTHTISFGESIPTDKYFVLLNDNCDNSDTGCYLSNKSISSCTVVLGGHTNNVSYEVVALN